MDSGTVALLLLAVVLSRRAHNTVTAAAFDGAGGGLFVYPDDDHVIITQYGPMRYKPISAEEMDRPYDASGPRGAAPVAGHYYKSEVIPLDIKTWQPIPGTGGGGWAGGGAVGGSRSKDFFDVPLRVGYTVRSPVTVAARRRRRHDYHLRAAGFPSSPPRPPTPEEYPLAYRPGVRLPPPQLPPTTALLSRY